MTITVYLPSVNTSAAYPAVVKALATPAGFEPATSNLEGSRSIQLSYGAVRASLYPQMPKAWKAGLFGSYPDGVITALKRRAAMLREPRSSISVSGLWRARSDRS